LKAPAPPDAAAITTAVEAWDVCRCHRCDVGTLADRRACLVDRIVAAPEPNAAAVERVANLVSGLVAACQSALDYRRHNYPRALIAGMDYLEAPEVKAALRAARAAK